MSYFVYTRSLYFDIYESKYYSKKIVEKLNNKNICVSFISNNSFQNMRV